ncbi:flagellar biosynthesis regulator FlaF [Cohaesibacter gelatinilyticus]|uniref:Flagellar protein FlaF n=1 Tax=Cohaesibacter gelatinilyticus TaxID=372072 RepID=A0A285NH99_9HYPH|nr:flagellar biosynthesis regulator FlaF [Cohaesibacter gelatinilyticus]SNZ08864.1 flagellar protein FlaF [Cohaesibacter gelatinilyticus]HAT87466.1 flagellar biosynthesis regulatory protein FlaF [Hyphomicrobiales bacterium]
MYNQAAAATAYQDTGQKTGDPRELEANLLLQAAAKLNRAKANGLKSDELDEALTFNRKLWTIFVGELLDENHGMPKAVRENLVNLGIFTFNHTLEIMTDPENKSVDSLININKNIAEGLRSTPA